MIVHVKSRSAVSSSSTDHGIVLSSKRSQTRTEPNEILLTSATNPKWQGERNDASCPSTYRHCSSPLHSHNAPRYLGFKKMSTSNTGTRRRTRTTATTGTPQRSASVNLTLVSQGRVSPRDAQQVLTDAFTADDYIDCIRNLTGWNIDPQAYIDNLDQVGPRLSTLISSALIAVPHQMIDNTLTPGSEIYDRCLRALRKTCGIYGILPSSRVMPQGLTLVTTNILKRPFASGGFADVWKARDDNGQLFAIKNLRTYEVDDLRHVRKVLQIYHSVSQCFSQESLPRSTAKRSPSVRE